MRLTQTMNPDSGGMDAQFAELFGNLMGYSTMSMHFTKDGVLVRMVNRTP